MIFTGVEDAGHIRLMTDVDVPTKLMVTGVPSAQSVMSLIVFDIPRRVLSALIDTLEAFQKILHDPETLWPHLAEV